MEKERVFKIREIYWVKLNGSGNVQNGWHPAVIVQNNKGNHFSNTITVVPITSAKKSKLPTHVGIKAGNFGLPKDSTVQCEGVLTINKEDIGGYIGTVDYKMMAKISKACLINTPFLKYIGVDTVVAA